MGYVPRSYYKKRRTASSSNTQSYKKGFAQGVAAAAAGRARPRRSYRRY